MKNKGEQSARFSGSEGERQAQDIVRDPEAGHGLLSETDDEGSEHPHAGIYCQAGNGVYCHRQCERKMRLLVSSRNAGFIQILDATMLAFPEYREMGLWRAWEIFSKIHRSA